MIAIRSLYPHCAGLGLTPVTRLSSQRQVLLRRRSGHIIVAQTRLLAIHARWWPYFGNHLQAAWDQRFRRPDDRCEIYYHVPRSAPRFLTLSYIRAGVRTTPATIRAACMVLDEIARIKGSVAIVSQVINHRLSDRILRRWGWEPHCESLGGCHVIKRFYGNYPAASAAWQARLGI